MYFRRGSVQPHRSHPSKAITALIIERYRDYLKLRTGLLKPAEIPFARTCANPLNPISAHKLQLVIYFY